MEQRGQASGGAGGQISHRDLTVAHEHFLRSVLALTETRGRTHEIFEREVQDKTHMPTTAV